MMGVDANPKRAGRRPSTPTRGRDSEDYELRYPETVSPPVPFPPRGAPSSPTAATHPPYPTVIRTIRTASSALLAAATLGVASPAVLAQANEVRACWLTQYAYLGQSENSLRAMAQNIRAGGMNTVYVNVYGGGGLTYWPSATFKAAGGNWASTSFDWARHLVRIFHEEGLEVGAWFEYGFALLNQNHPVALAHPDWLARDSSGSPVTGENGGFVFLSPGHPQAVGMLVGMARELVENYDFDDIQLDRIRWGRKTSGREYGYEAVTAAAYQAQYGVAPPTNVNNSTWVAFRENLVDQAMQSLYAACKTANPNVVVSSSPTGSYGWTQHMQRWNHWTSGGYIDLVMPQMYTTSLAAFQTEFATQRNAAGQHLAKLGVGYRAQDNNDWMLVRNQLEHARGLGVPHGALWVYHTYSSQVAIQDEIDNLPLSGEPWHASATNPFTSDESHTIVVDNADPVSSYTSYIESGSGWIFSAQPDFFEFDSRVASGASAASAEFHAALPRAGSYDVYAWFTASSNRNDAAEYTIDHRLGASTVVLDQRTLGGRWTLLGRYLFDAGPLARRVTVSNNGAAAGEYTSADAVRLVFRDDALTYCTAKTNSQGCVPVMSVSGAPTLSGPDDFHVLAANVINRKNGVFFWGLNANGAPFQGGTLCVQSPVRRTPPQDAGGTFGPDDCTGSYDFFFGQAYMSGAGLSAGSIAYGQFWSRDPSHPDGTNVGLTGGIAFILRP